MAQIKKSGGQEENEAIIANDNAADPRESTKQSQAASVEARIYIGASFRGVATGTIYRGDKLPPAIEVAMKEVPALKELLVPISELLEAQKQLRNPESALSRLYEASKNKMKGE
jgi:hypothetical protein